MGPSVAPTYGSLLCVLLTACVPPALDAADPDFPADAPDALSLEEREDLGGDSLPCPFGRDADCADDYLRLAWSLLPEGFDLAACVAEQTRELRDAMEGRVEFPSEPDLDADELAERVIEELAIEDRLQGLDSRATVVTRVGVLDKADYQEQAFLFEDAWVGTFRVRMLVPPGGGPHPALLALPGHPSMGDQTDEFFDQQHGRAYAEAGFVVAAPAFRAYDTGGAEHDATTALLCAGLSTLAVRHYEALLVHKLLRKMRSRGEVGRIGAVGHSGGSVSGNLLMRYADGFDAWVSDLGSTYVNVADCDQRPGGSCVLDESHLGVHAIQEQVNDYHAPPMRMPVRLEEYGYPEGPDTVLDFLDATLR